jgi:hypothetical protein
VGARVAGDEVSHRIGNGLEERVREPGRRHDSARVAQARRVFRGGVSLLRADREREGAALPQKSREPRRDLRRRGAALPDFLLGQVSDGEEQIVQAVGMADRVRGIPPLEGAFEALDRFPVEELPQLGLAEKLLQLRLVHRERLRAALGEGASPS